MSTYFSSSSEEAAITLIRQVWNENLDSEFRSIWEMIDDQAFVSMYTEFPGIVCSTKGSASGFIDRYQWLKSTVDKVKPAQVGLTISNGTNVTSWQFNLKGFDPSRDLHDNEALRNMTLRGIDFQKNLDQGIEVEKFSELLMSSGVVCNDEVTWVSFRSAFDFGYLVHMLSGKHLPDTLTDFKSLVKAYCGGTDVYDIKFLMKHCGGDLTAGLDDMASILEVELEGRNYEQQAGKNSLLTFKVFEKIKDRCLDGPEKHAGIIYGLGTII